MINNCKNCKYWIEPKGKDFGAIWGSCNEIKKNDLIVIYPDIGLPYDYDVVEIDIHPDFGCILWENSDQDLKENYEQRIKKKGISGFISYSKRP